MVSGGGVASVTAVAVVAVALSSSPAGPASSGFASGGTPATSTGPTLPPSAYNQHQAIAALTGAGRGWTNGSHSVTVTAGGTLAVNTECYGTGSMSVTVADAPQPWTTQRCAAESSSRSMQIATIAPGDYSSFHIQPGDPVTITATRFGGDSDQWRINVLRNPDVAVAAPSP